MIKKITYKLQAEGTDNSYDSWWLIYEDPLRVPDLIYKDTTIVKPEAINTDLTNTDLSELTEDQRIEIVEILTK
jgi:hypothetical protein